MTPKPTDAQPAMSDTMPMEPEPMGEDAEPEAFAGEAAGYMIAIKVPKSGGMSVCKKPLEPEREGEQAAYDETPVDSIEQAVKAAIAYYRQDPQGATEQQAFEAGNAGAGERAY